MLLYHRKSYVHFSDPWLVLRVLITRLYSRWVSLTFPFASLGSGLVIHPSVEIYRHMVHRIAIGNNVELAQDAWLNIAADLEGKGEPAIVVGDNCLIARRTQISAKNRIELENDVILSASVAIIDHNHAYEDFTLPIRDQGISGGGRIRIEAGCWIGYGAAILCDHGELVIGRNSVVAANAVVSRSCPPYSVLSGNPARIVKQYDPTKQQWVIGSIRPVGSEPQAHEKQSALAG